MDKEVITALGVAAAAILTPLSAALVGFRGNRGESEQATIKRLREELAAARADTDRERARADDERRRAREAQEQAEEQLREVSEDRDRGWDLARWWSGKAHTAKHATLSARQAAEMLAARQNIEPPVWKTSVELPDDMEEPIPRGKPGAE